LCRHFRNRFPTRGIVQPKNRYRTISVTNWNISPEKKTRNKIKISKNYFDRYVPNKSASVGQKLANKISEEFSGEKARTFSTLVSISVLLCFALADETTKLFQESVKMLNIRNSFPGRFTKKKDQKYHFSIKMKKQNVSLAREKNLPSFPFFAPPVLFAFALALFATLAPLCGTNGFNVYRRFPDEAPEGGQLQRAGDGRWEEGGGRGRKWEANWEEGDGR
jgi:hypothetical protein